MKPEIIISGVILAATVAIVVWLANDEKAERVLAKRRDDVERRAR